MTCSECGIESKMTDDDIELSLIDGEYVIICDTCYDEKIITNRG